MQRNYLRLFTKFSRANQVWKDLKDLEDPMGPKLVIYILSVLFMSLLEGGGGVCKEANIIVFMAKIIAMFVLFSYRLYHKQK